MPMRDIAVKMEERPCRARQWDNEFVRDPVWSAVLSAMTVSLIPSKCGADADTLRSPTIYRTRFVGVYQ